MQQCKPPAWAIRTEADRRALAAGYYWDPAAAERIVRFAEKYVCPKYVSGAFKLFAWQRRFLMCLYGWRKPDGTRRFRWAVLHVPKKNGKTMLVAIIALYELLAAGEPSALVVSASTAKENAEQVYQEMLATINAREELRRVCRAVDFKKRIYAAHLGAEYRSLSAESRTSEGFNCSCVIVDEAHAHRSQALFNALRYSTAGRPNGIVIVISTAGDDLTHFYYGFVQRARRVLAGEDLDPTFYAEVYEADHEKDDLEDPAVWTRCNPSLDLYPGFSAEQFGLDLVGARAGQTSDWLNFQRYRLNIFRRAAENQWIELAAWDACRGPVTDAELLAAPCWLGFDGSQTTDPSSVSAVWLLPGKRYFVRSWAWVAAEGVKKRELTNLPRYQQYAADGHLVVTEGNLIDKEPIRSHVNRLRADGHQVKAIVMDATGHSVLGAELMADGFEVFSQPQTMEHYAEPTRELAEAVAAGSLVHDGNTWLRWCVGSVRLIVDVNGRSRPARRKSVDKIDGAVSMLMAFGQAFKSNAPDPAGPSVYEKRGFLTL